MDPISDTNIEEAISVLLRERVVPGLKEIDTRHYKNRKEDKDKVLFHPLYRKSVRQAKEILPHAEPEVFPEELFQKLNPHQRGDEFEWLKNNYEPYTVPVFIDFLDTVKRGTVTQNYKIAYPPTPEGKDRKSTLEYYLTYSLPAVKSITTWFSSTYFDAKLKDANGVFAVRPKNVRFVEREDGSLAMDPDQDFEPIPVFYSSEQVLSFMESDHALLWSEEKSLVSKGSQQVREGNVLYLYTRNEIYKIKQVEDYRDYKFDVILWMEHNGDKLPAWKSKGIPKFMHNAIYYQSPYFMAVGNLNTMLKNKMVLEMAGANVAFPYRIMIADPCDMTGDDGELCLNGTILSGGKAITCPQCNGTGLKDKPSAGGSLLVEEAPEGETANLDRIRFVSPDTNILNWMKEKARDEEKGARSILHLYTTDSQATGPSETATGRALDIKSMQAFMWPILMDGYDTLEEVINAINVQRYGKDAERIGVVRPTEIDFKTSAEYLQLYKDAVANGAPPMVIIRFMELYIKSIFHGSEQEEKIWRLVMAADPFAAYSNDEVRALKGAGGASSTNLVLHAAIFQIVAEALADDDKLLEKPLADQVAEVVRRASEKSALINSSSSRSVADEIAGLGGPASS